MSKITNVSQNDNFLHNDYDTSKLFLFDNDDEVGELLNDSGAAKTFEAGLVMARVAATNQLVPLDPAGADGSQYPVGILMQTVTDLADAATKQVNIVISGEVAENLIILEGATTLDTVIENKTVRDRIKSDTRGIALVPVKALTKFDNQ